MYNVNSVDFFRYVTVYRCCHDTALLLLLPSGTSQYTTVIMIQRYYCWCLPVRHSIPLSSWYTVTNVASFRYVTVYRCRHDTTLLLLMPSGTSQYTVVVMIQRYFCWCLPVRHNIPLSSWYNVTNVDAFRYVTVYRCRHDTALLMLLPSGTSQYTVVVMAQPKNCWFLSIRHSTPLSSWHSVDTVGTLRYVTEYRCRLVTSQYTFVVLI